MVVYLVHQPTRICGIRMSCVPHGPLDNNLPNTDTLVEHTMPSCCSQGGKEGIGS